VINIQSIHDARSEKHQDFFKFILITSAVIEANSRNSSP